MTLSQICAGLEYCKRLKELGVKQKSLFYWYDIKHSGKYEIDNSGLKNGIDWKHNSILNVSFPDTPPDFISAFTADELGEMLQKCLTDSVLEILGEKENWQIRIPWVFSVRDKSEVNSRAAMLIHLLEQKLISVEDVNKSV